MSSNAAPSDSGTFPAARVPALTWAWRDIACTSARARGIPEWVIQDVCALYAHREFATRSAVWWGQRFDAAMGAKVTR
jgi:hypothetical protein